LRDLRAGARDIAAEARDLIAGRKEAALVATGELIESEFQRLVTASREFRGYAAADRAAAASDRRRSAADRRLATDAQRRARAERGEASANSRKARTDLEHAELDDLTGLETRDPGYLTLQHELDRSRRSGEPFVLAFIDIDGLKERNDTEGHAAGDELLTAVVAAIRSNLRSYDPLVRIGGDEFLCGFTNTDLEAAQRRVAEIQAAIARQPNAGSITVGLAGRDTSDTLKDITARADANMYARRPTRIPTRRGP